MCMSYGWGSTGENVTSERHTRSFHDVTSERYTTWRQICPTKDKISLHGSFTRMRILPRAYRNTITRIRFDASGYFSSSAIPLCASGHVSFAIWQTLIGLRCFWILLEFRNTIVRVSGHVSFAIRKLNFNWPHACHVTKQLECDTIKTESYFS